MFTGEILLRLTAQAPPSGSTGRSASTIFYLTLVLVFLAAVITTAATRWTRDKCLKLFHHYHITLERNRGKTSWGMLRVFSTGIEIVFDHPFVDAHGRKKTSVLTYAAELESQVLSLLRYHNELDEAHRHARDKQVHRTFNPGPVRRFVRKVRNFVNTLRDAFNAAIGAAVGQYQRMNPASAVLTPQGGSVTQIGQTLLGKFAGNAYEPLLEQYIGQPVILEVADPIDPNNASVQYAGYLAEYTQAWIALLNVSHAADREVSLSLPDQERGPHLPPTPAAPTPGAAAPAPPPALKCEHDLAVRLDGRQFRIQNTSVDPVVVRRLERAGFEPVTLGAIIPAGGTLGLPARDARGGTLVVELIRGLDVVAPRRFATVRHAGELVDRRGWADEMSLYQLPLVPSLLGLRRPEDSRAPEDQEPAASPAD